MIQSKRFSSQNSFKTNSSSSLVQIAFLKNKKLLLCLHFNSNNEKCPIRQLDFTWLSARFSSLHDISNIPVALRIIIQLHYKKKSCNTLTYTLVSLEETCFIVKLYLRIYSKSFLINVIQIKKAK